MPRCGLVNDLEAIAASASRPILTESSRLGHQLDTSVGLEVLDEGDLVLADHDALAALNPAIGSAHQIGRRSFEDGDYVLADAATPHGAVLNAIAPCKAQGARAFSIAVEVPEGPRAYERRCEAGSGEACGVLGFSQSQGKQGLCKDAAAAAILLDKGCRVRDALLLVLQNGGDQPDSTGTSASTHAQREGARCVRSA